MSTLLFGIALALPFTWFSIFPGLHGAVGDMQRTLCRVRMPCTPGAPLSGTAFGASGCLMQEALHNTLASLSIMGVNAGARPFVLLVALLFPAITAARFVLAFLGALLPILLVLLIVRRAGYSRSVIVLSGIAASALMSAAVNGLVTLFLHTVADKQAFMLGGFASLQYDGLFFSVVFILPGLLAGALFGGSIGLFALGDEVVQGLRLSIARHRLLTMVTTTALAATAVCIGGLIGFLGLIVPNVLRRFFVGRMSAWQMFTPSGFYDSVLLIAADFLTRRLFYPYKLPIGLLLSLLGVPFFIWMLMRGKRGI